MAEVREESFIDNSETQQAQLNKQNEFTSETKESFLNSDKGIRLVYLIVGFVAIGLVFYSLQNATQSVCCGDYDGYYHIRWSQLLWENFKSFNLLPPKFMWLPLTSLNPNDYVDHHYLFHILQIPFLWFFELTTAAKVSALLFATLAVFSCYWLIVRYQINYTLLWLLALLTCSAPFLYRMNMAKAPPLAMILLVIGTYLLFENKYKLLAPLMFAFVWAYSLWPLMWVGVIAWAVVILWSEERIEWQPLAYAAAGTVAGLIINPYFPKNLKLMFSHLVMKAGKFSVEVGQEWYAYDSWFLFTSCFIAFVAMFIGYISFRRLDKKLSARAFYFLVMSTVLMIMTFYARRFVEYFPPFAILFAAFSLQAMLTAMQVLAPAKLPNELLDDLSPYLDQPGTTKIDKLEQQKQNILFVLAIILSVVMLVFLFANVKSVRSEISDMPKPDTYKKGMEWVKANVPAGQVIFNTDWDDFPKMFYYDSTHAYTSGLDPEYIHKQNQELSKLYIDITLGKIDDPGPIIRDKFGAHYVFSDNNHDDFYAHAMESGWFDKVYEDADCFILKLRDKKGEAPPESVEENGDTPDDKSDNTNEPVEDPDEVGSPSPN